MMLDSRASTPARKIICMKRLLLAVAAVTLLAGCSSGGTSNTPTSSAPSTPSASSTTVSASTVSQWGSLVAQRRTPVVAAAARTTHCPLDLTNFPACSTDFTTFATTAQSFGIHFAHAQDATNGDYLGQAPGELTSLIATTNTAVTSMEVAETERQGCVPADVAGRCLAQRLAWGSARDGLLSALNGWDAYI